jgi:hypothetical protein
MEEELGVTGSLLFYLNSGVRDRFLSVLDLYKIGGRTCVVDVGEGERGERSDVVGHCVWFGGPPPPLYLPDGGRFGCYGWLVVKIFED